MFFQYLKSAQVICTFAFSMIIGLALVLKNYLKDKDEDKKRIPLLITGGFIVFLEIMKQFRNFAGFQYRDLFTFRPNSGEIDLYALPFHFCSFFIFFVILQFVFLKSKSPIKKYVDQLAFLWSSAIMVLVLFYPDGIYIGGIEGTYETGALEHTVLFHLLVILYWALGVALRPFKFELKKWWVAVTGILIFGAIAIPAAFIFKENYCSIYKPDPFDFLQPLFNKGYAIYLPVLICIGIFVSSLIYISICGIEHLRDKVKDNSWYILGYWAFVPAMFVLLIVSWKIGFDILAPKYAFVLTGVVFLCELPATVRGHINAVKAKKA